MLVVVYSVELKHNAKSYKSLNEVSIKIVRIQILVLEGNHLRQLQVLTNERVLQILIPLDLTGMEVRVVVIRVTITGLLQKHRPLIRLLQKHRLLIKHHRRAVISTVTMVTKYGRDRTLQTKLLYPLLYITQLNIKLTNLKMHISIDWEAIAERESILNSNIILNTVRECLTLEMQVLQIKGAITTTEWVNKQTCRLQSKMQEWLNEIFLHPVLAQVDKVRVVEIDTIRLLKFQVTSHKDLKQLKWVLNELADHLLCIIEDKSTQTIVMQVITLTGTRLRITWKEQTQTQT